MSVSTPNVFRLKGSIQQYGWGKQGSASLVARLSRNALGPDFKIEEDKTYAEVWMGTHQNGPAHLFDEPDKSLLSVIESNPKHYLGEALLKKWPGTTHVPYLFKILSFDKALALQVHPDKELAKLLQKQDPENFVDPNHKPEIAVTIGEPLDNGSWGEGVGFTGFVGFQPLDDIRTNVEKLPELRKAVGDDSVVDLFLSQPSRDHLKALYARLLGRPQDAITPLVRSLVKRADSDDWPLSAELARLVKKVDSQYPGDVGVLSTPLFLNFFKLRRGEAVYIGADEIHAYLEGDIIECMAVSDNVLNAGFVPLEERQTGDFTKALTFTARDKDHWRLPHETYKKSKAGRTQVYAPPFEEFVVLGTYLEQGVGETLGAVQGPTIGIVKSGKVKVTVGKDSLTLDEGSVVYAVPGHDIQVELVDGKEGEVWWAAAMI